MAAKVIHFKKNGSSAPQKFVADDGGNNISAVLSSSRGAETIFLPFYRHRAARKRYFCLSVLAVLLQTHSRTVLAFAGQLRAFRNVARTARGWRQASCRGENEKQSSEIEWLLFVLRYLAESNCSTRFCRPLPNRSAKVPLFFCGCKDRANNQSDQIYCLFFWFLLAFLIQSAAGTMIIFAG